MDLKAALEHFKGNLVELEASARKLPNANFADIIKSAHGKLSQASEHPDIDLVAKQIELDHDRGTENGVDPKPLDLRAGHDGR